MRHDRQDPTGQGMLRQRARKDLRRRLGKAQANALRLFRAIGRNRRQRVDIARNRTFYEYDVSAKSLAELDDAIAAGVDVELDTENDEPLFGWFWGDSIEKAYRTGTLRETHIINDLLVSTGLALLLPVSKLDAQQILLSEPYREALARQVGDNFRILKGFSESTSQGIYEAINRGIQAGKTPTEISADIRKRFGLAGSRADRIANTEINKAYNDAKMRLGRESARRLGVRTGVLHISALLATTRDTHASRHGHTYTIEAQQAWWNTGSNRINCYCSVSTVLVDNFGKIIDKRLQKTLADERSFFLDK